MLWSTLTQIKSALSFFGFFFLREYGMKTYITYTNSILISSRLGISLKWTPVGKAGGMAGNT